MKKISIIIITIFLIIFIVCGIFYLQDQKTERKQMESKNDVSSIQKQVNNLENQTPTSTILTASEEISNEKKIYTNSNLKYSIEYPIDWVSNTQHINDGNLYLLTEQRKKDIDAGKMVRVFDILVKVYKSSVELPTNDRKLSFEDWIQQQVDSNFIIKKETIVIDGVNGYQVIENGESEAYLIYVQKDSSIYVIEISDPIKSIETYKPTEIEQKIINSFKFL